MESARVRYLHTSFLIQKQRLRHYCTKHLPCCNLFILYLLRFSPSTRFSTLIRQKKSRVMVLFCLSASTLSLHQKPSVSIFRTECLQIFNLNSAEKKSSYGFILSEREHFVASSKTQCKHFSYRMFTSSTVHVSAASTV